jgi:hypothetical protein
LCYLDRYRYEGAEAKTKIKQQQTKNKNMAINFKKGPALSLGQADKVATLAASQSVIAGQVVRVKPDGTAALGVSGTPADDLVGFSLNTYSTSTGLGDGDAVATGSVGIHLVSGDTVLEVDQDGAASTINTSNYAIGKLLYANTDGKLTTTSTNAKLVGVVEGIRSLPDTSTGATVGAQKVFLGVKLLAA